MKNGKIVIAAPGSGRGKTMITIGLIKLLCKQGFSVSSFKCGPDYIDPMFHKRVLKVPSGNLDLFFTDDKTTRDIFERNRKNSDEKHITVVEGVMGLYDGIGMGIKASTYQVAKVIESPVVLVVDCKGMSYSVLAVIKGFLDMDNLGLIKGVILNRTTKKVYEALKPEIEKMNLEVIGFVPVIRDFVLESRHLGLMMPHEIENLDENVDKLAQVLKDNIDMNKLIRAASEKVGYNESECSYGEYIHNKIIPSFNERVRIAVAMDEAFCFYYDENIRLLQKLGADIIPFSPVHDEKLPGNVGGLILGGGYPEIYAKQLSENVSMRKSVAKAIESGLPSLAECGGFMYLHKNIVTGLDKNNVYDMAGVIDGQCYYTGRLVRFGYISLKEKERKFFEEGDSEDIQNSSKDNVIRGHEFHYYESTAAGEDARVLKASGDIKYRAGHIDENHWWSFAHLYYPSNIRFALDFIKKCRRFI